MKYTFKIKLNTESLLVSITTQDNLSKSEVANTIKNAHERLAFLYKQGKGAYKDFGLRLYTLLLTVCNENVWLFSDPKIDETIELTI